MTPLGSVVGVVATVCLLGLSGIQCQSEHAGEAVLAPSEIVTDLDQLEKGNDGCYDKPCKFGTCIRLLHNRYFCLCNPFFTGVHCDQLKTKCNPSPCKNGGKCLLLPNFGFKGGDQSDAIDVVAAETTELEVNNRNLGDLITYKCICRRGFTGQNCEIVKPTPNPLCKGISGETYNCEDKIPCTDDNINAGNFHFAHDDCTKFVQCDASKNCFTMDCPSGLVWNSEAKTCVRPQS